MAAALPFSKLYSHPGKPLEEHLVNAAAIAEQNFSQEPVEQIGALKREELVFLLRLTCLSHDLGKATAFFQEYLNAGEKEKKQLQKKEETRHGLLSALIAFYAAKTALQARELPFETALFSAFAAFMAVKRHHGNLDDALAESFLSAKNKEILSLQAGSMDKKKLSLLAAHLQAAGFNCPLEPDLLRELIRAFPDELQAIRRLLRQLSRREDLSFFCLVNYLFSHLVDADKNEAALGRSMPRRDIELSSALVEEYKAARGFAPTSINALRKEAFLETMGHPIALKERLYSLNLPTGLGKTLTSFAFALKLREKIRQEKGYYPRIIYCLPFLSVIEQNAAVLEEVCRNGGLAVDSALLLKHHHLADYAYKKDDDEFAPEEAKILLEGWQAEIIVTTFVQLFHTLVSNRNRALLKFHRLFGSIIILDEVQSIPFSYWLLVKEVLKKICFLGDVYVLLVTATEPLIFNREEVTPLVQREKYFSRMNRVVVKPRLDKDLTLEELADTIKIEDNKSYLFIFNTVRSAKQFYELLQAKTAEEIAFLSTHVVPYERLRRISMIREKKVRLAVSTQLVEAGVDIDFDVVYRDLAPLDAINQAAGRCNRHGERAGEVIVVSLSDVDTDGAARRRYASYIYDPVLLAITRGILEKRESIAENAFLEIVESYYEELQRRKSSDTSRALLAALYQLKYESDDEALGVSDFKLIAEDYPKIDVFIEYNEEAAQLWNEFVCLKNIPDLWARRLAFNRIKAAFYKYTVAVPVNIENIPPEVVGFRYVGGSSLYDYYDPKTGFKTKGELLFLW
jgi:CRISPR-associated endonuclease/helicase Cas3